MHKKLCMKSAKHYRSWQPYIYTQPMKYKTGTQGMNGKDNTCLHKHSIVADIIKEYLFVNCKSCIITPPTPPWCQKLWLWALHMCLMRTHMSSWCVHCTQGQLDTCKNKQLILQPKYSFIIKIWDSVTDALCENKVSLMNSMKPCIFLGYVYSRHNEIKTSYNTSATESLKMSHNIIMYTGWWDKYIRASVLKGCLWITTP